MNVVSNRLPIRLSRDGGVWQVHRGSGGLVQAMEPVLQRYNGNWIGWPGVPAEEIAGSDVFDRAAGQLGYRLSAVHLSAEEVRDYYTEFSNSVLWPLFHGFSELCEYDACNWDAYRRVNEKFAEATASQVDPEAAVWIHDYQLVVTAHALRQRGHTGRIGFFLHIPFPPVQDFVGLPCRDPLLLAFFANDLIGFQTTRDRHNFLDCVEHLVPAARIRRGDSGGLDRVELDGQISWVGTFPIGIDAADFDSRVRTDAVAARAAQIRSRTGSRPLMFGVDRLDYTKGLLERFAAYETMLQKHPELRERVELFQLVVPSRSNVPQYQRLKHALDRTVGRINGELGTPSWSPIRYTYGSVDKDELAALYLAADVALVTPLRDGMNLVAKEYCSAQIHGEGVLVLGEMAGTAAQLRDAAILVNPRATEQTADAIYRALQLRLAERARRMNIARENVFSQDVFWWANTFLEALAAPRDVSEYAPPPSYFPTIGRRTIRSVGVRRRRITSIAGELTRQRQGRQP